ncbi:hypothetical protein INT47_007096 [Mucor saturninus]|uniref:V-type proton ATPase subunit a n=1 Tax=Mucor saturninus TaxID=64648 RepID=A0A8H7QQL3_9FUNG|nr:hypothetical protein INT47_007096 [Mucor saturninus]
MASSTTLFRSEEMSLIQLFIPAEVAHSCVAELGELGKVQFSDLNPSTNAFQRTFVSEIRRLDEMERQCRFLQAQIEKSDIQSAPVDVSTITARTPQQIDDLEENLKNLENRITQMNEYFETLQQSNLQITELRHVLKESSVFFAQAGSRLQDSEPLLMEDDVEQPTDNHLGYVTGVIPRSKIITFERVLWRVLRGNLFMNFAEIDEPVIDPSDSDKTVTKNVFAIFAHGHQVINKIKKISESMGGTLYTIDESSTKRNDALLQVTKRIKDLDIVLAQTKTTRRQELMKVADNITAWTTTVKKEKAIYHTMNLFNYDVNRKCLIAEGWAAKMDVPIVHIALKNAIEYSGTNMPSVLTELHTKRKPPTYHRTDKFSEGFQSIIDAYGIARYREVNPGLFTIVAFPFLFAIMFGDIGHGCLLLCLALYLVLNEKSLAGVKDEIFSMLFSGRYMMLLMAIFSIFTGCIYNDVFSLSLNLFKSGFDLPSNYTSFETVEGIPNGNVYAFGFDPAWHGSENFLLFSNSYKMKQAIIIGVIHMSFAICLNIFNHLYYKKNAFIWLEFLPQILFMESVFGYLIFCIMYKWSINWWELDSAGNHIRNPPPNLLNMLIYMFLTPGQVNPQDQLFPGQGPVQLVLISVALICVPWMWFAKPYYLKLQHEKHQYHAIGLSEDGLESGTAAVAATEASTRAEASNATEAANAEEEDEEEEFEFSEVMIHQTIHTIEFCLNCISNTASYLRLWALSLAHAQLSSVLWDMTLKIWFSMTGPIAVVGLVLGFAMWFVLTIGILLCMEGLSAFLHALRLIWVEFNSKFYNGDGIKFEPFAFSLLFD